VEAGKVEVRPLEFEVENLFAALRGMLRPLLLNQAVDLIFDDATHIPRVFSDEGKVSQILRNFISNALKFTERGEIRVSAALAEDGDIRFCVSDTGIGIAAENIDLIFQDFAQVDNPIQKRVRGTGLGLPLSKKLATVLGGNVGVRSHLGSGSDFTLQIPLRYRGDEPEQPAAELVEVSHDPSRVPLLVVDDRPEMMVMYRSYLASSEFDMWPASSTREAEDAIERMRPAAIVLDIMLRWEDSWALLARLKSDDRTKDIPVMVASTIEDRNKGFHLGADSYLLKPFEQSDLLRELRNLTGQAATTRALIIDDQERDRYLLKQRLRDLPLQIIEAPGGVEGLRLATERRPDVIFLDLSMPDLSGFEVFRKLKGQSVTADIPVIIVTSLMLSEADRQKLPDRDIVIVRKDRLEQTEFAELLRSAGVPAIRNQNTPLEKVIW
jgi:CheY-like chemotaxis protein